MFPYLEKQGKNITDKKKIATIFAMTRTTTFAKSVMAEHQQMRFRGGFGLIQEMPYHFLIASRMDGLIIPIITLW